MRFLIECLPLFAGPLALLYFRIVHNALVKRIYLITIPLLVAFMANQVTFEGPRMLWMDLMKAFLSTAVVMFLNRSFRKSTSE
jgi:hypothetical protein